MKLIPFRAALTVAAVYGYFLLFAQFAFVELLRENGMGVLAEKTTLGLMAAAGIAGGFYTAWHGQGTGLTRSALAVASITALLTPFVHNLAGILPLSLATGAAVGIATVSLAAMLPACCGVAWVGLGTGIGYALCNLPTVFTAPPQQQSWMAASFALAGIIVIPSPRMCATEKSGSMELYWLPKEIAERPSLEAPGPRRDDGVDRHPRLRNNAGTGVSGPESEFSYPRSGKNTQPSTIPFRQSLLAICINPWAAIMILTSLVWLDSAAFFIIQHEQSLKQSTWGDGMLWRNAALHLGVAVLAGQWLRRSGVTGVILTAWGILAVAAFAVNADSTRTLAGWWYPVGVSLYSTVMVAWPGWFSGARDSKAAAWKAACLFSIAGWFGSANGIGMAESLHRVPVGFIAASGILVAVVLALHVKGGWRALVVIAVVAVTALLFSSAGNFAPQTVPDAARGHAVYVAEGCIHCHSQYVRPRTPDAELWGPATGTAPALAGKPVLIGNRRQGPDLQNIGARRSAAWLKEHFINPRLLSPDTTMPSYQYLFEARQGDDLVAWLKTCGADLTNQLAETRNSWQPSPVTTTDDGARLFLRHCVACHGVEGRGDGVLSKRFVRPPANLVKGPFLWTTGNTEEQFLKIARAIKFGIPGTDMPGHEVFTDSQVRALTAEVLRLRE